MHNRRVNQWVREGDFFEETCFGRSVTLHYLTPRIAPIKSIYIGTDKTTFRVEFICSPFYESVLLGLLKQSFDVNQFEPNHILVKLTPDFMSKFTALINQSSIDKEQASIREQFSADIMNELQAIVSLQFDSEHKLPNMENVSKAYINPRYKDSDDISLILSLYGNPRTREFINFEEIILRLFQLLIHGDDPDQLDERGLSPLSQVIMYYAADIDLIKLFLMYGANPFLSDFLDGMSPIEHVRTLDYPDVFNYIMNQTIKVEKPLSPANLLSSVDTLFGNNEVTTIYRFLGGKLFCILKPVTQLSDKEMAELYQLFKARCEDNEEGFQSIYVKDPNRFVVIIRNEKNEIVGSVVYDVKTVNEKLYISIDFEIFSATHPNFGVMSIITYQFPFSLQLLYPETEIWMIFFAASYSSFKRISKEAAIPKYQPEGKVTETVDVLRKHFGFEFNLNYDEANGTICSVVEPDPIIVKENAIPVTKKKEEDIFEELFNRFRGGRDMRSDVMVSLPVTADYLRTLQRIASLKQINFYRLVYDLANTLSVVNITSNKHKPQFHTKFFNTGLLFWRSIKMPDETLNVHKYINKPNHKNTLKAKI